MFAPVPRFARRLGSTMGLVVATVVLATTVPASAGRAIALGPVAYVGHPDAVPGSFVVVLKDDRATAATTTDTTRLLAGRYGLDVTYTYTAALRGMAVRGATEQQARRLAADPLVALVAQDLTVSLPSAKADPSSESSAEPVPAEVPAGVSSELPPDWYCPPSCSYVQLRGFPPPSWSNIDRLDERTLPLDNRYAYPNHASSIRAYVIDSGIRVTHQDFGGRAMHGYDSTGDPPGTSDCNGHGTHVAGVIGGGLFGVAKNVTLVGVRVVNCAGSGTYAGVIAGVDWVTHNNAGRPSVASLAVSGTYFPALNNAVTNSIAYGNVHYSVAAGNSSGDACYFSPASTPHATTVAAVDPSNDTRASFSNFGTCVDLYAPGVNITAAWMTSDSAYNTRTSTTHAVPHMTGLAALWRHQFPASTPQQVAAALTNNATPNLIIGNPAGTPNLLSFMGMFPS